MLLAQYQFGISSLPNGNMRSKSVKLATGPTGFTLVELLVSILVVVALTSVVFAVFSKAKKQAKTTVDISNLRQIGVARALYLADYDDRVDQLYASTLDVLVQTKRIPEQLCISPNDPYPTGLANRLSSPLTLTRLFFKARQPTSYPVSYISISDFQLFDDYKDDLNRNPVWQQFDEGAWLIEISGADEVSKEAPHFRSGAFHRLQHDGSVRTRIQRPDEVWLSWWFGE